MCRRCNCFDCFSTSRLFSVLSDSFYNPISASKLFLLPDFYLNNVYLRLRPESIIFDRKFPEIQDYQIPQYSQRQINFIHQEFHATKMVHDFLSNQGYWLPYTPFVTLINKCISVRGNYLNLRVRWHREVFNRLMLNQHSRTGLIITL